MKILRTDADRCKAMISRPIGRNVTALECCNYREVQIPPDLGLETKRHVALVVILKWFRFTSRDPVQRLREKGL
jgi:hypothetical protein